MSDAKISALPPATLPLAGTELVPLDQSGVTVSAPVSAFQTGGVGSPQLVTANFNALAGGNYQVKTSIAAITATLPVVPAQWATVVIADTDGNAVANPITIGLNGQDYLGSAVNPVINVAGGFMKIMYNGTQWVSTP